MNIIVAENLHPSYVIDNHEHKTAVMLPIQEYNDLLEDIHDLAMVAERIHEPTISHAQVFKLVKKRWISTELNEKRGSVLGCFTLC